MSNVNVIKSFKFLCLLIVREEIDQAHALSASLADVQKQGHISVINRQLAQHPAMMATTATASAETSAPPTKYQSRPEDFPTLDGASQPSQPASEELQQPKPSVVENTDAEPRPPSLAKKLAMSNRLSVRNGQMDIADFPSLSSAKPAKTRKGYPMSDEDFPSLSSISKAKHSKTSAASVWNTSNKGSSEHVQPSGRAKKSKDLLPNNSDDDFPSLRSSAAAAAGDKTSLSVISRSCNSLADISRNFSSGSLSRMTDQADTASNPSSLSWGPDLSRQSDDPNEKRPKEQDNLLHIKASKKSSKSAVREAWGGQAAIADERNDGSKQVAASSDVSSKPAVSSVRVPAASSETNTSEIGKWPDSGLTADGPGWTHIGGEKKAQYKPSKNSAAKVRTEKAGSEQGETKKVSKSSAKAEETSSQSKNGNDKAKKKPKANKAQKETAAEKVVSKQSFEKTVPSDKSGMEKGDSDVRRKQETPQTLGTLAAQVASSNGGSVEITEKQSFGDGSCTATAVNREVSESVPDVADSSKVDVTQSSAVPDFSAAVPVFSASDFPSLPVQQLVPSSLPSLPPGFSNLPATSSKPPPPGFSNPVGSHCAPPGLNSALTSAVVSDAGSVDKTNEADSAVPVSTYLPPRDMQQRTASLVGFISGAVKDGSFGEFRDLSEKFRAGTISASEYHSRCCDMMDSTAFRSIFPELIALLPDLPKQNQLLKVHRDFLSKTQHAEKSRSWSTTTEDGLVSCVVCGQVLRHSDLPDHASEHDMFNADYPTLPSTSLCSVR